MSISRRQKWLIISIETVFLIALAVWILLILDRLFEPVSWIVALSIILAGDLVSALVMQHFSPTRITVEPGEVTGIIGEAISEFGGDEEGRVMVRGERWNAKCANFGGVAEGDSVRIISREGLTLLVERAE